MKRVISIILTLTMLIGMISVFASAALPFTDVKEKAYYYKAVEWAVEKGVTAGITPTTFQPNDNCTRGQVVTFLWRAAGSPEPKSTTNPFTDVKEKAFYYKAVLWAVESGVTSGISATSFAPNQSCTRGQVVSFLHRASGSPAATKTEHPFTDVKEKAFYFQSMLWAVETGVTAGLSATTFGPSATCTRGQIVSFLYRYVSNSAPAPETPAPETPAPEAPAPETPVACEHAYDNACDKDCNKCGETRTTSHAYKYESSVYGPCTVCGNPYVSFTTQPPEIIYVEDNSNMVASVEVTGGTAPYTFTWYISIPGWEPFDVTKESSTKNIATVSSTGNKSTLTISVDESYLDTDKVFYCRVTDKEGKGLSSNYVVAKNVVPMAITSHPYDMVADCGSVGYDKTTDKFYGIFDVAIVQTGIDVDGGVEPYTYRWQYSYNNGSNWFDCPDTMVSDSNKPYIAALINFAEVHSGKTKLRCIVTDATGKTLTSNGASVGYDPLEITHQPYAEKDPDNANQYLKGMYVSGGFLGSGDSYSIQWQQRTKGSTNTWTNVPGDIGTTCTLKVWGDQVGSYEYRCKVTDVRGNTVYSDVVTCRS